jgi:hypothetical protein
MLARTEVYTLREYCKLPRRNNTSGATGVYFVRRRKQPLGKWQARIKLADGRKVTKSFAVKKFGKEEAFRRAVAARADLLQLVDDVPLVRHPDAKRFLPTARNQARTRTRKRP